MQTELTEQDAQQHHKDILFHCKGTINSRRVQINYLRRFIITFCNDEDRDTAIDEFDKRYH